MAWNVAETAITNICGTSVWISNCVKVTTIVPLQCCMTHKCQISCFVTTRCISKYNTSTIALCYARSIQTNNDRPVASLSPWGCASTNLRRPVCNSEATKALPTTRPGRRRGKVWYGYPPAQSTVVSGERLQSPGENYIYLSAFNVYLKRRHKTFSVMQLPPVPCVGWIILLFNIYCDT